MALLRKHRSRRSFVTASVSEKSGKGKHTTTSARLYPLPEGGAIIDTPGVRSVALGETSAAETGDLFPEIREAGSCRFNTCTHRVEPGCAVREAVSAGEISGERYDSYLRLREEIEQSERKWAPYSAAQRRRP